MSSLVQATCKRDQMLAMSNSQSGMIMPTRLHNANQSWFPTPEFNHLPQVFLLAPLRTHSNDLSALSWPAKLTSKRNHSTRTIVHDPIFTSTQMQQFRNDMKQKGEQELQREMSRIQLLIEGNTREDENHHLQASTHKPPRRPKNRDHFLDQNASRKTGGPIVGPPVLRAGFATRKWALVFGPCQKYKEK